MKVRTVGALLRLPMLFCFVALVYWPFKYGASIAAAIYFIATFGEWLPIAPIASGISIGVLTGRIFSIGSIITLIALKLLPTSAVFMAVLIIFAELLLAGLQTVAAKEKKVIDTRHAAVRRRFQTAAILVALLVWVAPRDYPGMIPSDYLQTARITSVCLLGIATIITVVYSAQQIYRYRALLHEM